MNPQILDGTRTPAVSQDAMQMVSDEFKQRRKFLMDMWRASDGEDRLLVQLRINELEFIRDALLDKLIRLTY